MFKKREILFFVILILTPPVILFAGESSSKDFVQNLDTTKISPAGEKLAAKLDRLDVEHHWLKHENINWQTGDPDNVPLKTEGGHTHCSAFVASATEKLGIYILRPPEHPQNLLANAQHEWLFRKGPRYGWKPVPSKIEAQYLANEGYLVVVSYKNPDDEKPGHIAIVRPYSKSRASIRKEGPQIIQAGLENYHSAPMKKGFAHHLGKSRREKILFYSHEIKL